MKIYEMYRNNPIGGPCDWNYLSLQYIVLIIIIIITLHSKKYGHRFATYNKVFNLLLIKYIIEYYFLLKYNIGFT